jgi:hypothetical protein
VAPSKWMVNVSLADSSREIPLPLSKINVDRIGAVQLTPVRKTMMGKDVMAQFDERQSGEREVRQVLRGNLLRASDKYGKEGNVVNATLAGGGVEPMLLLPRGYDLQQQLSESPVVLPAPRNVQQFMEISDREGIVKTSDEQITLKAAPNAAGYLLQTGKKQKDVYLDEDLMAAVGDEFYSVSDRMEARVPPDHLEAVVSYLQGGRQQQLEAVTHLEQARELMGENIPEFTWSASVEDVIESAGLAPSLDLSNLDAVRDRLESTFAQADEPIEVPEHRDEMPVPAQPADAGLTAKVQQAQNLANQGMAMTFQVDMDPHVPGLETSVELGEDGRPQFELFDPDDIRLEEGTTQLLIGIDSRGDTLEDLWVEIPDAEAQLETAISQARPLDDALPRHCPARIADEYGSHRAGPSEPNSQKKIKLRKSWMKQHQWRPPASPMHRSPPR